MRLLSGHLGDYRSRYELVLIVAGERESLVKGIAVVCLAVPRSLGVLGQWRNDRAVVARGERREIQVWKEVYPKVAQCHHDVGAFFTTTLLSRPVTLGTRPGGPQ